MPRAVTPKLRLVPDDPDPREFPFVPNACDMFPRPCHRCYAPWCAASKPLPPEK
jgi:hypothetical protein